MGSLILVLEQMAACSRTQLAAFGHMRLTVNYRWRLGQLAGGGGREWAPEGSQVAWRGSAVLLGAVPLWDAGREHPSDWHGLALSASPWRCRPEGPGVA